MSRCEDVAYDLMCALTCALDKGERKGERKGVVLTMAAVRSLIRDGYRAELLPASRYALFCLVTSQEFQFAFGSPFGHGCSWVHFVNPNDE